MNALLRVCITVTIVSFALAACTPIGSVFTGSTSSDDFWTVPQRQAYNILDSFDRNSDLRVFSSSQGAVETISTKKVEISLITNPGLGIPNVINMLDPSSVGDTYRLAVRVGTGRKLVVVKYGNSTAEYSIEVADPDGLVDPIGNGEGSGIGIFWK